MVAQNETADPDPVSDATIKRAVVAASIGNCVEWFDFAIFGLLAATLGALYFPSEDESTSLLAAFAVFGAAFVVRPLGGMFFGPLGDRIGRRRVLSTIILVMSGATFAIGLLPTYATIGIAAPILLVVLRLIQGFTAGGELTGATTFVAEYAPPSRRGFLTSWIQVSCTLGLLLGLTVPTLLAAIFSPEAISAWAWRIPFLLAGPLGVVGLYLRLRLDETPAFKQLDRAEQVAASPLRETLVRGWRAILLVGGVGVAVHLGYFVVLTYTVTYMTTVLDYSATAAFIAVATAAVVDIAVIPFSGALSDRYGRKPLLATACVGFVLLTFPAFWMLSSGDLASAIVGLGLLGALHGLYCGAVAATFVEIFSTRVRFGGFSIGHNVSAAIFGGSAPLVATLLIAETANRYVPAFIVVGGAVLSLVAVAALTESARLPLKESATQDRHPSTAAGPIGEGRLA